MRLLALLLATAACGLCSAGDSRAPHPDARAQAARGAFATGHYRNLFEEAGRSQQEIRKKIDTAFEQLFNLQHKMVRFTPDRRRPDHTDPSYHLPAFYELWAPGDLRPIALRRQMEADS